MQNTWILCKVTSTCWWTAQALSGGRSSPWVVRLDLCQRRTSRQNKPQQYKPELDEVYTPTSVRLVNDIQAGRKEEGQEGKEGQERLCVL